MDDYPGAPPDDPAPPTPTADKLDALLRLFGLAWCEEHQMLETPHEGATADDVFGAGHGSNMGFPQLPPVVGPGNP